MPKSGAFTKAHFIDDVAETNGFSHSGPQETIEKLLEIIKRTLESGEDILISGFGKFCVKEKEGKKRRPKRSKIALVG